MENIDSFLEQLLEDKGIVDLDPEIKQNLIDDMRERLITQINRAAIEKLPEEKTIELSNLVDNPDFDDEKLSQFLKDSGVNMTQVAVDTMLKFREYYLNSGEK